MENEEEVGETSQPKKEKMLYYDNHFRKHLTKALKCNGGEPGNIDKIRG